MESQRFRAAPVFVLAVLAPFCAEYLVGGISLSRLAYLPFLMPLYGAAAVLIHEIVRRAGRGWPTILGLGAAFGAFQAGLVDASMFDPDYAGLDLGGPTVPWIDWNVFWGLGFIVNHAILSIAVPIAVTEALFDRGGLHRPWMGMTGHWSTVAWLAGGFALIGADERQQEGDWPTREQQAFALVLTLALVAAAYRENDPAALGRDNRPLPNLRTVGLQCSTDRVTDQDGDSGEPDADGHAVRGVVAGVVGHWGIGRDRWRRQGTSRRRATGPGGGSGQEREAPSLFGTWLAASLVLLVFNFLPPTWLGLALGLGLVGGSLAVGLRVSRLPGWSDRHRLAVAAGVVTVTAPFAFVVGEFIGATEVVDLVGHGLFAVVAAGLLAWGFRRLRGEDMSGGPGWHGRP